MSEIYTLSQSCATLQSSEIDIQSETNAHGMKNEFDAKSDSNLPGTHHEYLEDVIKVTCHSADAIFKDESPYAATSKLSLKNSATVLRKGKGFGPKRSTASRSSHQSSLATHHSYDPFTRNAMSVQRHREREMFNRVQDVRRQLEEVTLENQTLRAVDRLQGKSLSGYHSQQADSFSRGHAEKVQNARDKLRKQKKSNEELHRRLMETLDEIDKTRKEIKRMNELRDNEKLGERDELERRAITAEAHLEERNSRIKELENSISQVKSSNRQELNVVRNKRKEALQQLNGLDMENQRLEALVQEKDKELKKKYIYSNYTITDEERQPLSNRTATELIHSSRSSSEPRSHLLPAEKVDQPNARNTDARRSIEKCQRRELDEEIFALKEENKGNEVAERSEKRRKGTAATSGFLKKSTDDKPNSSSDKENARKEEQFDRLRLVDDFTSSSATGSPNHNGISSNFERRDSKLDKRHENENVVGTMNRRRSNDTQAEEDQTEQERQKRVLLANMKVIDQRTKSSGGWSLAPAQVGNVDEIGYQPSFGVGRRKATPIDKLTTLYGSEGEANEDKALTINLQKNEKKNNFLEDLFGAKVTSGSDKLATNKADNVDDLLGNFGQRPHQSHLQNGGSTNTSLHLRYDGRKNDSSGLNTLT